jgi:hypothetical protein
LCDSRPSILNLSKGGSRPDAAGQLRKKRTSKDTSEVCLNTIGDELNIGQALGSEKFKDQIEAVNRSRVRHLSAGRKPKRKDIVEGEQTTLDL